MTTRTYPRPATALGFEVRYDVGYGGVRRITIGPAGRPGTFIVF